MAFQQTPTKSQNIAAGLDEAEKILGRLSFGAGKDALKILTTLDDAQQRFDQLSERGVTPRAEFAQFETVCASLRKEGREFLKQIGGAAVLVEKRKALQPPRAHWWWYLDEELATAQRQSMLRTLRNVGIALAVLVVAAIVYRLFFAPDPQVIAEVDAQQNADLALSAGNMSDALAAVEVGLTQVPDSAELLIYKALILKEMGNTSEAEPLLEKARQLMNDEEVFVLTEAQTLSVMNKPQEAIDLLNNLLAKDPSSARAYLMLGGAYELIGDQASALDAYETASTVGEANDDTTTVAQARIKLGMLMQVYGMSSPFDVTPTVAATATP